MSQLIALKFNLKQFKTELQEFSTLLATQHELSERSDILPFFKSRPYLSLGISWLGNVLPDTYAHEFNLWGKFQSDLVVGRSHFLNEKHDETERLSWRMNQVIVNSKRVLCYTYDELCQALMEIVEQMSIPNSNMD